MIGCSAYDAPQGTQVVQTDHVASVTCLESGKVWELRCMGSLWKGDSVSCGQYLVNMFNEHLFISSDIKVNMIYNFNFMFIMYFGMCPFLFYK